MFVQKPFSKYFGALHLFPNRRIKFYKDYQVLRTWKINHRVAIIFVETSIRIYAGGAAHRNIEANNMVLCFSIAVVQKATGVAAM